MANTSIKIGIVNFNKDVCKGMSKKEFYSMHKAICEKHNVDIDYAYEKLTGKKAKPSSKSGEGDA